MAPHTDLTRPETGSYFAAARRRRDRWTGALTALLIVSLTALALRDFPTATPATCQPPGTLTKATL